MRMGQTSIPVDSGVRDRLATDKPDDMNWSEYLSVLHSDQDMTVDTDTSDVSERLDRNYEAIKEATQAAQNAESAITEATQR